MNIYAIIILSALLLDFGIEVWEEKQFEVIDYCNKEVQYTYPIKDLDLNETCFDIGCTSKDESFCNCSKFEKTACGSHLEPKWIKVFDNFYGFKAVKGNIYRLRVWGKRKAGLGSNNVDWIPTFFGKEITKWAWWNSSCNRKTPILLHTSEIIGGNVTQDFVLPIDINSSQTTFWANVQTDGNDVRFIATDDLTELDYYFEEFDYDNKSAIAWVEMTDTFPSATDLTI